MPRKPENLSRRIVRDVIAYTGGKPQERMPIETIARRLVLRDAAMVAQAVELARANGWLLVEGNYSACLSDEGRRLSKS